MLTRHWSKTIVSNVVLWFCGADGARQRGTVCEEPSEDQEGAVSCECGAAERRRTQVNRGSCSRLMADQQNKCFFYLSEESQTPGTKIICYFFSDQFCVSSWSLWREGCLSTGELVSLVINRWGRFGDKLTLYTTVFMWLTLTLTRINSAWFSFHINVLRSKGIRRKSTGREMQTS